MLVLDMIVYIAIMNPIREYNIDLSGLVFNPFESSKNKRKDSSIMYWCLMVIKYYYFLNRDKINLKCQKQNNLSLAKLTFFLLRICYTL